MYDAWKPSFVQIKKPPRQQLTCPTCNGTIGSMTDSIQASQLARGPSCTVQRTPPHVPQQHEISVQEYHRVRQRGDPHLLLDVRVPEQFDLCHLPGAMNIPLSTLSQRLQDIVDISQSGMPVYCICRRGLASAVATNMILQKDEPYIDLSIYNVAGGLDAWRAQMDESFPQY
jgi:adenylyltransferase and sulfurtransferase